MILLLLAGLLVTGTARAMRPQGAGVVVESVEKGTTADAAGLRRGDRLVSWRPAMDNPGLDVPAGGPLASPFDLARIEIEVVPRVPIVLVGERDGRPLAVRIEGGEWRVRARPLFDDRGTAAYAAGEALARAGQVEPALAAWRDLAESAAARHEWTVACWLTLRMAAEAPAEPAADADDMFDLARDTCASTGAGDETALAQQQLARAWQARHRYDESEAAWREALRFWEAEAPHGLAVAGAHHGLGLLFWERGQPAEAERCFQRALEIRRALAPESLEAGATLDRLGVGAADWRGDVDTAVTLLQQALGITRRLTPDSLLMAERLRSLANLMMIQGRYAEADDLLQQALAAAGRIEPEGLTAGAIEMSLGATAGFRGDLATADGHFRRAQAIGERHPMGDALAARGLHNLANVAQGRGDWETAEVLYRRALSAYRAKWPESVVTAAVLANFAAGLIEQGRLAEAEATFREAIALGERSAPRSATFAFIVLSAADLSLARDDLATAEALADRVLRLTQEPDWNLPYGDDLFTLKGRLALRREKLAEAEDWLRQAIALATRLRRDESLASAWRGLAMLHRRRGEVAEAAEAYRQAVAALEAQRGRLGGGGRRRLGFGVRYADLYHEAVEAILAAGSPAEAFHYWERSRARAYVDMLAERDMGLDAELPAELRQRRRALDAEYDRTHAAAAAAKEADKQDQLLARLRQLRVDQQDAEEQARRASPRLASLVYPQPLTLEGVRRALEPGVALLAYSVGSKSTVLLAVAAAGTGAEEPGPALVVVPLGTEALAPRIAAWRRLAERTAPPPEFFAEARALYDLLVRPVERHVASAHHLVICPDGPLHQLPFAALRRNDAYLARWKPLTFVPSGTVLSQLAGSRPAPPGAAGLVAFGDPLAAGLPPLAGGRDEVARIKALFPGARAYLGAEATKERVKTLGNGVRYVHFAGHGLLDERLPLESALAFSPEPGEPQRDRGLLHAWEIFERVRLDADLVTLSACRSAAGTALAGEGLLGLTRAFQYAGARSVMASLWRVPDKSTPAFMSRFYGGLKRGLAKDEALRRAQLSAIRAGHHPMRWASFQLYGDWR